MLDSNHRRAFLFGEFLFLYSINAGDQQLGPFLFSEVVILQSTEFSRLDVVCCRVKIG